jgi:hypothetical protein
LCIHVPTFDATAATQSARKSGSRSGLHVEGRLSLITVCG